MMATKFKSNETKSIHKIIALELTQKSRIITVNEQAIAGIIYIIGDEA